MKKIILWSVVGILIVGIAVAGFFWFRKPQTITLSDGTKLTLLGVDYGKHHKFPKAKIKGLRTGGGPNSFDTTNDTLVVWILAESKGNQWPNYQLMVYDKAETACVSSWAKNSSQFNKSAYVQGFTLDAYPRWDRKIILRVAAWNNNGGGLKLAKEQFVISNPARGSFPKWTADTLPDTQSDGDLDVTLTRLNYGVGGFNGSSSSTKNDPMNKAVIAAFHTEQKGVTATNWQPMRIETSDAAGNQIKNSS